MIINKDLAQEIKSVLQEKVNELKEFGLFIEVGRLYYTEDRFCVDIKGMTEDKPFVMQKGMKII